jgi:hypothetical protein
MICITRLTRLMAHLEMTRRHGMQEPGSFSAQRQNPHETAGRPAALKNAFSRAVFNSRAATLT